MLRWSRWTSQGCSRSGHLLVKPTIWHISANHRPHDMLRTQKKKQRRTHRTVSLRQSHRPCPVTLVLPHCKQKMGQHWHEISRGRQKQRGPRIRQRNHCGNFRNYWRNHEGNMCTFTQPAYVTWQVLCLGFSVAKCREEARVVNCVKRYVIHACNRY